MEIFTRAGSNSHRIALESANGMEVRFVGPVPDSCGALTGKKWSVVIIEAGVSVNKNLYREEVLARDYRIFDRAPCRIFGFRAKNGQPHWDHAPDDVIEFKSGSVTRNTVGFFEDPQYEKVESLRRPGNFVMGITAILNITNDEMARDLINSWNAGGIAPGKRSQYELSIDADGDNETKIWYQGQLVRDVKDLSYCNEVTIVSAGSAGGRLQRCLASSTFYALQKILGTGASSSNGMENSQRSYQGRDLSEENSHGRMKITESQYRKTLVQALRDLGHDGQLDEATTGKLVKLVEQLGQEVERGKGIKKTSDDSSEDDIEELAELDDLQKVAQFIRAGDLDSALTLVEKLITGEGDGDGVTAEEVKEDTMDSAGKRKSVTESVSAPESVTVSMILEAQVQEPEQKLMTETPSHIKKEETEPKNMAIATGAGAGSEHVKIQESTGTLQVERTSPPVVSVDQLQNFGRTVGREVGDVKQGLRESVEAMEAVSAEMAEMKRIIEAQNEVIKTQSEKTARIEESAALKESDAQVLAMLKLSGLVPSTQDMIAPLFIGRRFKESDLTAQIDMQRKIQESNSPSPTSGMDTISASGYRHVAVGMEKKDWVQAQFDVLCGYKPANDKGLRESTGGQDDQGRTFIGADAYREIESEVRPRQLFEEIYDDRNLTMRRMGRNALREAVIADLPNMLSAAQNKALVQEFRAQPTVWQQITEIVNASNLKPQRRVILGGFGTIPIVGESDEASTYLSGGTPKDDESTYNLQKRGRLAVVSYEAIINDDLNAFKLWPQKLGRASATTLQEYIFKALLGNLAGGGINTDNSFDGLAIYSEIAHNNLTLEEMDYESVANASMRLDEIEDFAGVATLGTTVDADDVTLVFATNTYNKKFVAAINVAAVGAGGDILNVAGELMVPTAKPGDYSLTVARAQYGTTGASHTGGTARVEVVGDPIAFDTKWFIYSNKMKDVAYRLISSALMPGGQANDASMLFQDFKEGKLKPLAVHSRFLGRVIGNWFMSAGKCVEAAFLGGKQEPEFFLQDNPLVGGMFNGDFMTWKLRHFYGCYHRDHRLVQAGLPA